MKADDVLRPIENGRPLPCGLCQKPVRIDRIIRLRNAGIPLICCSECGSRPNERGGLDHRRGEGARIAKHHTETSAARYMLDIREYLTKARAACDRAIDGVGGIILATTKTKEASTQTTAAGGAPVQVMSTDPDKTTGDGRDMQQLHTVDESAWKRLSDCALGGAMNDVFHEPVVW